MTRLSQDAVRLYKVSGKNLPANRYGVGVRRRGGGSGRRVGFGGLKLARLTILPPQFHHKYISSAIQAIAQRRDQQAAQIEAASV